MFTAGLAAKDSTETVFPVLADSLPQLNTDTWRLFPDGRMETMYRLKPGLAWHDGRPLTADDFAFALRAFRTEARWVASPGGDERKSAPYMDEIVALDSQSLVIRWARPYPGATDLLFQPLPRHLLETSLDQDDADAYYGLDYWTSGYVGAGPYRLARWERNAFMEGTAFEVVPGSIGFC
jgi:ABC-type transport system substrate-binding protein